MTDDDVFEVSVEDLNAAAERVAQEAAQIPDDVQCGQVRASAFLDGAATFEHYLKDRVDDE